MTHNEIARRLTYRLGLGGRVHEPPHPYLDIEDALVAWLLADDDHATQAAAWLAHPVSPEGAWVGASARSWASQELELRRPVLEALGVESSPNAMRGFVRWWLPRTVRRFVATVRH